MSAGNEQSPDPHSRDEPGGDDRKRDVEQREEAVADREEVVDVRESRADSREEVSADRAYEVRRTLAAAEGRDDAADERDRDADSRDRAANLDAFVNGIADPKQVRERQRAGADRTHSHADRIASGVDRSTLTDSDPDVSGVKLRKRSARPTDENGPDAPAD